MDSDGWVPVEVVCGFKRMRQLNIDEEVMIQVIATSCFINIFIVCCPKSDF